MTRARIAWPPYPFEAGFCITDDPDASTLEQTRAVYDFLAARSFVTTKAVWAFNPDDVCGHPATPPSTLRGITLENKEYLSYCKELYAHGFELCPHGASAGNNKRERTKKALDLFADLFCRPDTFICHSKNAENIYWEEKTTSRFPLRLLLGAFSRHSCEGEVEKSPYFWGDLSYVTMNQIRLFRTRCLNTLKRNPSMPYFDPYKPLVNGWFTATKRSLADCTTEGALEVLKEERGLTVLYQYLHRYADTESGKVNQRFVDSIERISSDPRILIGTVSSIMKRLRAIQGVFIVYCGNVFWLINVNDEEIENLRIESDKPLAVDVSDCGTTTHGCTIVVNTLMKNSVQRVQLSDDVVFSQKNAVRLNRQKRVTFHLPLGKLMVNLSSHDWKVGNNDVVRPGTFFLKNPRGGTGNLLLSGLSYREEWGLLRDQSALIAREIVVKGRSIDANRYLDASQEIRMENHDHW